MAVTSAKNRVDRPTHVLVCGQPFEVKWEDRPAVRLTEHSDFWNAGTSAVTEQQLVVRSLQGEHQLRDTLLHEIVHCIVKMTGQDDRFKANDAQPDHPEEPVVYALATALLAVLRANPELVAWLTEEIP